MQPTAPVTPDLAPARIDGRLTDGETAVLALMAQGRSNAGIAALLGLSHRTVECHVSRVFDKLSLPCADPAWNRRVLAVRWWWQRETPDAPAAVDGVPALRPVDPVGRG